MGSKSGPGAAPKRQQGVGCPKGWLGGAYWETPESLRAVESVCDSFHVYEVLPMLTVNSRIQMYVSSG